jgi:hypothetical protein
MKRNIKAEVGDTVFEFRPLKRAEYIMVQDILGNPAGDSPKFAKAFELACQTCVIKCGTADALIPCTARDFNAAADDYPGAILAIGGALYAQASEGVKVLAGE